MNFSLDFYPKSWIGTLVEYPLYIFKQLIRKNMLSLILNLSIFELAIAVTMLVLLACLVRWLIVSSNRRNE